MNKVKNFFVNIGKWFKKTFTKENFKNFFVKIGKWFKRSFTAKNINAFFQKDGVQTLITSILCALFGILIGYIVLLIINPQNAFKGIMDMLKGSLSSPNPTRRLKNFGTTLARTAPLILTGLSILFAYKAGLFNIGVAGQYTVGVAACLYGALVLNLPWYVSVLLAIIIGAIWGGIAGFLKAYLNVNEVISGIMLNWIGLYLTNIVLHGKALNTVLLSETWAIAKKNEIGLLPQLGLNEVFGKNKYIGIGLIIAIIVAIVIQVILSKTTFGYELKATGNNRFAAKYAGMKEKQNIIITLVIAGGMAGLSAATLYLTDLVPWYFESSVPSMGFDGISAAFLGGLNPIGTIISAFFLTFLKDGAGNLDTTYYTSETASLITSIIIYLCAFVLFIKELATKKLKAAAKKIDLKNINKEGK